MSSIWVVFMPVDHFKSTACQRLAGFGRDNSLLIITWIVCKVHPCTVSHCISHRSLRSSLRLHHSFAFGTKVIGRRRAGDLTVFVNFPNNRVEHFDKSLILLIKQVAFSFCIHSRHKEVSTSIGLTDTISKRLFENTSMSVKSFQRTFSHSHHQPLIANGWTIALRISSHRPLLDRRRLRCFPKPQSC